MVSEQAAESRYGPGVRTASRVIPVVFALGLAACGSSDGGERSASLLAEVEPAVLTAGAANQTPARPDDAEAQESFPVADPSTLTQRAPAPETASTGPEPAATQPESERSISPGAPSDEQIARELKQMAAIKKSYDSSASQPASGARATLNQDGTASPPRGAPELVRRIISAGNAIAKFPYVYGGGHGSFVDTAYDCSGSVSYALAAAELVDRPLVSGEFARMGEAGPGEWVTIYANEGHMFMVVAGLRYDTSGRGGPLGSRWQTASRSAEGLQVRHPRGL